MCREVQDLVFNHAAMPLSAMTFSLLALIRGYLDKASSKFPISTALNIIMSAKESWKEHIKQISEVLDKWHEMYTDIMEIKKVYS